jgi:predicted DNA-binding protein with PD1-like motif
MMASFQGRTEGTMDVSPRDFILPWERCATSPIDAGLQVLTRHGTQGRPPCEAQRGVNGKRQPMKSQLVSDTADAQVHVVILDSGEEAFSALTRFANEAKLTAASMTAIGAFEKATVGWFDFASKSYKKIEVAEQCEVLSAIGDVAVGDDGKASLHVHIVLGLSDGSTRGGHLLAGTVRPTLEVVLTEVPSKLRRKKRTDLGIALIDIGAN